MSIRDLLETFDGVGATSTSSAGSASDPSLEAVRATAFEAGYASGWDDAKAADDQARSRVQAEFERNVEAISFTYHEAVDRVRSELKTFVEVLLSEFLPDIIPVALREHVRAELLTAADSQIELPVQIVVSPNCMELVSELAEGDFAAGIEVVEDKSLVENQVFVRISENEKEVNLAPLVSELKFQLRAMTEPSDKAQKHG